MCTRCGTRPAGARRWERERQICHACYVRLGKAGRLAPLPAQVMTLGVKRDCAHKRARHTHGTRTAYVLDRCGCIPCRQANTAYERDRFRLAAEHRWDPEGKPATPTDLVDAGRARAHLEQLRAGGMSLRTIAATSGIAHGSLYPIIYGKGGKDVRPPRRRITRELEGRILAAQLVLADGARVDGTGTARRLQALVATGRSMAYLADRLGIDRGNFTPIVHGRRQVTVATRRAAVELYDELWDAPPPERTHRQRQVASRARRYAAGHGWVPPLAWDDDTIDDPAAGPAAVEDETPTGKRIHADDVEWLAAGGLTLVGIAARLGVRRGSIEQALKRDGRDDLWERLSTPREAAEPRARIVSGRRAS